MEKKRLKEYEKAQAAFEFLMTYGWALLVTLVAISALAFFGVLSPRGFLPDQCTTFAGFPCSKIYASSSTNQLSLTFQNSRGQDMRFAITGSGYIRVEVQDPTSGLGYNLTSIAPGDCNLGGNMGTAGTLYTNQNQVCLYSLTLGGPSTYTFPQGARLKGRFLIRWRDVSGGVASITHERNGNLALTVEP